MNGSSTWKDTVGCAAVLLAIFSATASFAYLAYADPSAIAVAAIALQA